MFRKNSTSWKVVFACAIVALGSTWQLASAAEQLPPAGQWVPKDALVVVEIAKPKALLDAVLAPKVIAAAKKLPAYQKATSQPGFQQFLQAVSIVELRLGADWRASLEKLVGGGVTWAVTATGGNLLIVDSTDPAMLQKFHEVMVEFSKGGDPNRVASADYQGVTGWTLGPGEAHAIIGNRLLVTNKPEILTSIIELRAQKGQGIDSVPAFQAAQKAAGADAVVRGYLNVGFLTKQPQIQEALKQNTNPLACLLLAGVTDTVREANWLALGLRVEGETLALQLTTDADSAFARPAKPGEGALPNLAVPRQIAGFTFYRDLHGFYAAKDKLFPERTSGLIFFENMMGIFFTGKDLTEEVLAEIGPDVRLVAAEQAYDPAVGTPEVKVPAFAAVFRMRNPKKFAEVAEEAWQKALGLVNFTRGQQALPGLIIDRQTHGDVRYSLAYFASASEKDKTALDARFNLRPALAAAGDYLILSSTDGLAKDLIDAIKKQTADQAKAMAGVHSAVQFNAVQLASVIDANHKTLARQNMVEKGATQEQADAEVTLWATLLKHLGQVRLMVGDREGQPRASLKVELNLPSP